MEEKRIKRDAIKWFVGQVGSTSTKNGSMGKPASKKIKNEDHVSEEDEKRQQNETVGGRTINS